MPDLPHPTGQTGQTGQTGDSTFPWFFGLVRESGGYRIAAAGSTEAQVRRALQAETAPTLIAIQEELPPLGISEHAWRPWLPKSGDTPLRGAV